MSDPTTSAGWISRLTSALGPRGGLALLVVAQFILTVLQSGSVPDDLMEGAPWLIELSPFLTSASDGLIAAQVVLICAFVSLGDGRSYVRLLRGALLLMWVQLARIVGTHLLDAGRDASVFEEFLALDLAIACVLAVVLAGYRLVAGKRLTLTNGPGPSKHQFKIWQLLVLTAEIALQIAIIRALVTWNTEGLAQFRNNVTSYLRPSALFFLLHTSTLAGGALLIVLHLRGWSVLIPVLLAWPVALAIVMVLALKIWPQLNVAYSGFGAAPRSFFESQTLIEVVKGWAIEANLLVSLLFARWLGYDFLPFPRRGGGRQSSEATSAA